MVKKQTAHAANGPGGQAHKRLTDERQRASPCAVATRRMMFVPQTTPLSSTALIGARPTSSIAAGECCFGARR